MNPIDRLTVLFEKFPGIGPRQARRFTHYLLSRDGALRAELAELIKSLGAHTKQCTACHRWFAKSSAKDGPLCAICADPGRDRSVLFVVEKDADIENVEHSGFKGLYFVLGGTIPLASETPEKHVRLKELLRRVSAESGQLKEIILGLSATTEGDHTRLMVQEILGSKGPKISSLGRGLSTGSELEYADPDTIASALQSRT